jgi:copper transport protein
MSAPSNSTPRARSLRRALIATLVGVAVAMLGVVLGATPVSAHTSFVGSDPANGAVVSEPVEQITLRFTGVSEEAGDGFVVLDANGDVREPTSVSTVDDKVFVLAFEPALDGGVVGVRWSVRAGDNHPIDGSFSFTVDAGATATAGDDMSSMTPAEMAAMGSDDMSSMSPAEMAAMDEFLQVDQTRPGETTATIGRLLSIASIVLALGFLVFAATTLRGSRIEVEGLISAVRIVGAVMVVGAAIEYLGIARIAGESLASAWSSSAGFAIVLRTLAGLGLAIGLVATTTPVPAPRVARSLSSAVNSPTGNIDADFWGSLASDNDADYDAAPVERNVRKASSNGFNDPGLALARNLGAARSTPRAPAVDTRTDAPAPRRSHPAVTVDDRPLLHEEPIEPTRRAAEAIRQWQPDRSSWLAYIGIGLAITSFWFDGHTVTKGFRPLHALANSVHIVAGSVWVGGVIAMAVVLWTRRRQGRPTGTLELVVRFSAVASVALGAVVVAGLVMAVSILDSFGELTSTQWGQTLLLKSAAAGLAMLAGAYNHFRLMPALERNPNDTAIHDSVRTTVAAEAILLGFVVIVTASLVAAAS